MITRIWHGRTRPEHQDQYLEQLLTAGTEEYRQTPGNLSARIWRKPEADACHFWTVTEWSDLPSVKAFAGEDFDRAKYYPEDQGILLEFEEQVQHYECFDASRTKIHYYISQLEQTYHGGNWLNESFAGKLRELTAAQAFATPIAGVHSVAELVWHCIYWRTVLIHGLHGDTRYRDETRARFDFLPLEALQEKGWEALCYELQNTQVTLRALLLQKNDGYLQEEYRPGYTYEQALAGTIQHDIYHLGQIGLVLKIQRVVGKSV
ncbi:DinB family protein [Dawidia soli]|uniref:DinB family protein n=1 Tax=Dawidia soli TaxID=2782352 RepID=A0AAP2DFX9_9BACT|nr:DinB family protein [Dawidia soli]MBT1690557.1 DinB family protein [Dawidia soli]